MVKPTKSGSNKNSVNSTANKTKKQGSLKPGAKDTQNKAKDTQAGLSFTKPVVNELKNLYERGEPFDKNWPEHREETEYVLKPDIKELILFWEKINEEKIAK
ncbi:hypothetical protein THOM_2347 [Trachipleistophora hominis]|uniref:Uncharacterized protein n=1 Tax=Trachipleistophora hominis TaxID=72359 RepID=L7JUL1_TRAHO|nr:hypothetical protein THOM_2347 [Trachipleistophora hominis]